MPRHLYEVFRSTISQRPLQGRRTIRFISGFQDQSSLNRLSTTQSTCSQRHKSSLVGTSETARSTLSHKSFYEWLAGLLDGAGNLKVSKNKNKKTSFSGHLHGAGNLKASKEKKSCSLEITMGLEDLHLLRTIQHNLGGAIRMRAGAKGSRYRQQSPEAVWKVMNWLNGHLRHSARLLQFHRVCQVLGIPLIQPNRLDAKSNWFAGFFDANGTISITMKHPQPPQLHLCVTNTDLQVVEAYKLAFGGNISFESGRNGYYQWSVENREDVLVMLDYFRSSTFRSHQSRRFFLIEEYYSLYDLQAFQPDSIYHKGWLAFLQKWERLTI